ncbi:MAG TPA: ATP-binding protein [Dissulfurispiraceae bacterium]|nr:ATP-binding protein [Dissulfurispiraceae bacterium]
MNILKPLIITISLILLVVLITAIQIHFIKLPSLDVTTRIVLTGLLTVNIAALLTLIFFVGKNLYRLFVDMHLKVPGYKFRTKLVAIFMTLILIPSIFLFLAASGLATDYFNRLFSPKLREPIDRSVELARSFYDLERERVLTAGREAARGATVTAPGLTIRKLNVLPRDASDVVREAFEGKESTEVISMPDGDMIRAAVPSSGGGIVLADIHVPASIAAKSEKLRSIHEEYLKLGELQKPLKLTYVLTLGFLTLIMVFSSLWVSLKISRDITTPIQGLAMATAKVASGDLDVQVEVTSKDEIGLLVGSFNQMVAQLKDNKASLEEAYEVSDRRRLYLENILQNITSGVIFLDNSGRILTINKSACAILDLKETRVVGMDYRKLIAELHSDDLLRMIRDIEGKEVREVTREVRVNPGGRPLIVRVTISGIRESYASSALGMLVVFDDLTDVIKAQKAEAWQEVARRITHEIKNPLTPIKLSTERLIKKWQNRDEDFGAVLEKSTKTIIAEVEDLRRLVDIFSKYGKMPEINKAPADLSELVDSVAALYRGYKEIRLNVEAGPDLPKVNIDAEQIRRALINILDNAIAAMKQAGEINISVRKGDYLVFVDISDTGPGIPDDEKEKLFLPYFSKRKGGTGLGLAISSKIAGDHGGRIIVRDNQPQGSIFTIEIPIGT